MTTNHTPRVFVGVATRKGSVLKAQLAEAPVCVSFSNEDVLCQVAIAPGRDGTREQVTIDGKPRQELPDAR